MIQRLSLLSALVFVASAAHAADQPRFTVSAYGVFAATSTDYQATRTFDAFAEEGSIDDRLRGRHRPRRRDRLHLALRQELRRGRRGDAREPGRHRDLHGERPAPALPEPEPRGRGHPRRRVPGDGRPPRPRLHRQLGLARLQRCSQGRRFVSVSADLLIDPIYSQAYPFDEITVTNVPRDPARRLGHRLQRGRVDRLPLLGVVRFRRPGPLHAGVAWSSCPVPRPRVSRSTRAACRWAPASASRSSPSGRPARSGWAAHGPAAAAAPARPRATAAEVDAGLDAHAVQHVQQVLGRQVAAGARGVRAAAQAAGRAVHDRRRRSRAPPARSRAPCPACRGSGPPASPARSRPAGGPSRPSPAWARRRRWCRRSRSRRSPRPAGAAPPRPPSPDRRGPRTGSRSRSRRSRGPRRRPRCASGTNSAKRSKLSSIEALMFFRLKLSLAAVKTAISRAPASRARS